MVRKNTYSTRRITAGMLGLLTAAALAACGKTQGMGTSQGPSPSPERIDTGFVVTGPDSYDSADTAVLVDRDPQKNTLTFLNPELGRRYTLSLDDTTRFCDKYGDSLSLEQIETGEIVDITFLKSDKHLTTLQLSQKAWSYEGITRYELNTVRRQVTIGPETFKITDNTQYLSQGKNIDIMDLNPADVLCFSGIDTQVLSVRVEKGHGYLRLENDENFVGGWIEIGQSVVRRITEDMLIAVPEGNYDVTISRRGGGGTRRVAIGRDQETVLDIGDMEIPEPQSGMVLFSVSPSTAELYIDGQPIDISGPVTLEYGLHQLIARAEGYQSITQYIRVGQESAGINVELDPYEPDSGSESSEAESTESTVSSNEISTYYKVHIDSPEDAEVYLDGSYIGKAPCSFVKSAGTHVITFRRTGYTTRSYTIQVDSEEKDISFAFADLVPSGGESGVSGNIWDQLLDQLN